MPKGKFGCWLCGEKVTHVLQLWLRDYQEPPPGGRRRRQVSVASVSRALCEPCACELASAMFALLDRVHPRTHGCGTCGARTDSRIQLWLRTKPGVTVKSKTTSYCAVDTDAIYSDLVTRLDPDGTWRVGSNLQHAAHGSTNLAVARARVGQDA